MGRHARPGTRLGGSRSMCASLFAGSARSCITVAGCGLIDGHASSSVRQNAEISASPFHAAALLGGSRQMHQPSLRCQRSETDEALVPASLLTACMMRALTESKDYVTS